MARFLELAGWFWNKALEVTGILNLSYRISRILVKPPLHYLILFACNGPSIGLPDSFYVQWTLH